MRQNKYGLAIKSFVVLMVASMGLSYAPTPANALLGDILNPIVNIITGGGGSGGGSGSGSGGDGGSNNNNSLGNTLNNVLGNAPVISGVNVTVLGSNLATITFSTNVPTTSIIDYGIDTNRGLSVNASVSLLNFHVGAIVNLQPGTLYHFVIRCKDANGRQVISPDFTFTTLGQTGAGNNVGPSISGVVVKNISPSGAEVVWNTSEPSSAQVEYGASASYGLQTPINTAKTTSHSINLSGLAAEQTYNFRVKSTNNQNEQGISQGFQFSTSTTGGSGSCLVNCLLSAPPVSNILNPVSNLLRGGGSANATLPAIGDLSATAQGPYSAKLKWTPPTSGTGTNYLYDIRWSKNPLTEENFDAGFTVQDGPIYANDLLTESGQQTYMTVGLTPATTYNFAMRYSNPLTGDNSGVSNSTSTSTSTDTTGGGGSSGGGWSNGTNNGMTTVPSNLQIVETGDGYVALSWNNPTHPDFVRVKMLRKTDSFSTGPKDGTTVYEAAGTWFMDTKLVGGQRYYYTAYAYNSKLEYSTPVTFSLVASSIMACPAASTPNQRDLRLGQSGEDVKALQTMLARDKAIYPSGSVTGYFGTLTRAAVMRMQAKMKVRQTGVADAATWNALAPTGVGCGGATKTTTTPKLTFPLTRDLTVGSSGADVSYLQTFLQQRGLYTGAVSGSFDQATRLAVVAFQQQQNITPQAGYCGIKTRNAIKALAGF